MKVTVKLFATLRNYNENKQILEVDEGSTPKDIIKKLNVPETEVAIIMINGRGSKLDSVLKEADVVALFPAVGGG